MKKIVSTIFLTVFALVGVFLVAYPYVSFWLSEQAQSYAIQEHDEMQSQMSAKEIEEAIEQAVLYNENLLTTGIADPFTTSEKPVSKNYLSVLNIAGDGMMGYIKIPKIKVEQPIYHGTSEKVLQKGVGHLQQSSVPIGGVGTHTVLTGHTGLNHSKMFTDLEQLEVNDEFYIYVLDQVLAYKIDQILVVEPEDTEALQQVPDKEYATLITCTPYAVNSHRLLVRGHRVPYNEEQINKNINTAKTKLGREQVLLIAGVTALVTLIIIVLVLKIRKNNMRR